MCGRKKQDFTKAEFELQEKSCFLNLFPFLMNDLQRHSRRNTSCLLLVQKKEIVEARLFGGGLGESNAWGNEEF